MGIAISGLTSDIVTTVAKIFYQISSKEQTILENKWQSYKFPIKQTFVQFKADKLMPFERKKLRRLLTEDENSKLVSPFYTKFPIENDHCSEEDDIN